VTGRPVKICNGRSSASVGEKLESAAIRRGHFYAKDVRGRKNMPQEENLKLLKNNAKRGRVNPFMKIEPI